MLASLHACELANFKVLHPYYLEPCILRTCMLEHHMIHMVPLVGLEPTTYRLQGGCSAN